MELEVKTMEKNATKIRSILTTMSSRNISEAECLESRQVRHSVWFPHFTLLRDRFSLGGMTYDHVFIHVESQFILGFRKLCITP
jgi:hypothetical protein